MNGTKCPATTPRRMPSFTWSTSDTFALIEVWSEPQVQRLIDASLRNTGAYQYISKRLQDMGIQRTPEQCREKVKKLKQQHRKFSQDPGERKWAFYDVMTQVLDRRASVRDVATSNQTASLMMMAKQETHNFFNPQSFSPRKGEYIIGDIDEEESCSLGNESVKTGASNENEAAASDCPSVPLTSEALDMSMNVETSTKTTSPTIIDMFRQHVNSSSELLTSATSKKRKYLADGCNGPTTSRLNGEDHSLADRFLQLQKSFEERMARIEENRVKMYAELEEKRIRLSHEENEKRIQLEHERECQRINLEKEKLKMEDERQRLEREHQTKLLSMISEMISTLSQSMNSSRVQCN